MYFINFYVPEEQLEIVKEKMFAAGAGQLDGYEKCCWQTQGIGQFLPQPGSQPHVGAIGQVEKAQEWKVEMVCTDDKIQVVWQHYWQHIRMKLSRIKFLSVVK